MVARYGTHTGCRPTVGKHMEQVWLGQSKQENRFGLVKHPEFAPPPQGVVEGTVLDKVLMA